jgi:hypothetical protein
MRRIQQLVWIVSALVVWAVSLIAVGALVTMLIQNARLGHGFSDGQIAAVCGLVGCALGATRALAGKSERGRKAKRKA